MEINLVEMWLRKDRTRWGAGVVAGMVAGAMAAVFAMLLAGMTGGDPWFPLKLLATIVLGPSATELGFNPLAILAGLLAHELLCGFLGFLYSHFVFSNAWRALVPMGLVWGIFTWIFIWNLYSQSFKPIFAAQVPSGIVFFICLVFGLSLSCVRIVDRMLRGMVSSPVEMSAPAR